MENAAQALKLGFAVLVLVMALSVSIFCFNKVKETSDMVLYTKDETNYYEYTGIKGKASQNRIVGLETIIPTLYKYYKENYTVLFREASYNDETGNFGDNIKPLNIYKTPSRYKSSNKVNSAYLWGTKEPGLEQSTYDTLMQKKYENYFSEGYNKKGDETIFSFDLEEETLRHEPWTGNYQKAKQNIDCFLYGTIYKNPNNNTNYIDYSKSPLQSGGFIAKYGDKKFVETVGEYTYNSSQATNDGTEDGSTINDLVKKKNKRIIIFTLIKTN